MRNGWILCLENNDMSKRINYNIKRIKGHADERGYFLEILRISDSGFPIKQVSIASIKPGEIRGNHYHNKRQEWFLMIGGEAELYIANPFSREKKKIGISEEKPVLINIMPYTAHAFKNISKKIIYIIEIDDTEYIRRNPDIVSFIVCK